jgi:hypothetical protein
MQIVINEFVSPEHGCVFVDTEDRESLNGTPWKAVRIVTPNGVALMTLDQWKHMLAIGISMLMQEGTTNAES